MRIGFVGLGHMGAPMATLVAKGGHDIVVFDIDTTRAKDFAQSCGAQATEDLAVIGECDAVITMLPTGKDVQQVILEAQGGTLFGALRPGSLVVDMSSSEPIGTQTLGATLARRGALLIDAPVSGGVIRARNGTLAIMIGCDDPAALEKAYPVLRLMGDRIFETGGLGTGHAMKALNNFVAASSFAATAEALMIGAAFGLDRGKMVDIMNVSTGRNFHTDVVMKDHVVAGKFATGFAVGLLAKDVKIAEELGEAFGIEAPLTRLVSRRWADARDKVGAGRDNTEAYLAWDTSKPIATDAGSEVSTKVGARPSRKNDG